MSSTLHEILSKNTEEPAVNSPSSPQEEEVPLRTQKAAMEWDWLQVRQNTTEEKKKKTQQPYYRLRKMHVVCMYVIYSLNYSWYWIGIDIASLLDTLSLYLHHSLDHFGASECSPLYIEAVPVARDSVDR